VYVLTPSSCNTERNRCLNSVDDRHSCEIEDSRKIGQERSKDIAALGLTYLDHLLTHIGGLTTVSIDSMRCWQLETRTKLLTMTLDSPDPLAGPVGAAGLAGPFAAALVLFLIPPTGPVGAALLVTRRPPRPRPRPRLVRLVLMISSRPWSSLEDILGDVVRMNCLVDLMVGLGFLLAQLLVGRRLKSEMEQ